MTRRFVMPFYPQHAARGSVSGPRGMVGEPAVPDACWQIPGFTEAHDALFDRARDIAENYADGLLGPQAVEQIGCAGMSQSDCEKQVFSLLRSQLIETYGCGGTGTKLEPIPNTPCASEHNKMAVQAKLWSMGHYNDKIDGNWGPNSQKALDASGQTYQQLAPGCTGPVPHYTAGTGGGTTTTGGGGTDTGDGTGGGLTTVGYGKKDEGTSPWLWAGLAALGVVGVGVLVMSQDENPKPKPNPVRRTKNRAKRRW